VVGGPVLAVVADIMLERVCGVGGGDVEAV
jgi:hypothetical protein